LPGAAAAERRQLTVMFCDMVGSTALSTRLDPEEQRDVVSRFQECCARQIERFDGNVAQFLGDGVLAYFGYPTAHEDDAERAVRAGLALIKALKEDEPAQACALSARIGIATGVVVVGDLERGGTRQENAAIGETTNLAARLQALAQPNGLLLCPETYRLVGLLFEYQDLGLQALKGFAQPIHVRRVTGTSGIENRFEARHRTAISPLLGREEELQLLLRRWAQAERADGRVVLVSGEAGIGKSRLIRALEQRLIGASHRAFNYHASPHQQDSALQPIIQQLRRAARIEREDASERQLAKLEAFIGACGEKVAADLPVFAALLSISAHGRYALPDLPPHRLKERSLQALLQLWGELARDQPLLVVFEDVHWLDPTSLELLSRAVDASLPWRLLLLVTARPEFSAPWPNHQHVSSVALSRLGQSEGKALAQGLVEKALPEAVLAEIVRRTDGVPLFIEELTKTILETGVLREGDARYELDGPLPALAIPATLHASLLARLDRLPSVKDVVESGAAIGREFSWDLVAAVSSLSQHELQLALEKLVTAGLIFQRGVQPNATFLFKHALVRDAAYAGLLRGRRAHVHGQIAKALERRPEVVASEPELLAHHLTEAGLWEAALPYWLKAAERAVARSALREAAKHFREAIRLSQRLQPCLQRTRSELDVHIRLGPVVMATHGYSAPESLEIYRRADELVAEVGDVVERMDVLLGLFNVHYGRCELDHARAIADEHMRLVERHASNLGRGHTLLGQHYLATGAFVEASRHFQEALAIFAQTPEDPSALGAFGSQQVVCLSLMAGIHFARGEMALAQQASARAIELARSSRHTMSTALAIVTDLLTPLPGGLDPDPKKAQEVVEFCREHGLKNFEAWASFAAGAVAARRGEPAKGIAIMQAAMATAAGMGSRLLRPVQLATLAMAHAKLGAIEDCLRLNEEAIATAERSGEMQAAASLLRAYGEALLHLGRSDEARRQFERGLKLATAQQASFEEGRLKARLERRAP
jgi:class 3 adenylate cyclase/predicted negative regulator of RcsB-dependent stress response